ncbi:protransforming growth factor alpha isoform X2 [Gasterosteus aculeatus]|uniref:Transforming growth factor, alpha n=1 Tax=Gasterosteus aculeatus aculeatus TaxID=481459 RepID=A0AAQ4PVC5_GASAC|nr:protransforming growth factor alpha isoform X2 [Gasterosteus aculeatus aculeatus]
MMTRIFWDTIFLISGTLFTFGAGPSNSTIIEAGVSIDTNSTGATNASSSATTGSRSATTTTVAPTKTSNVPAVKSKSRPSLCQKATGWFKLVVKPSRTKISLYFLLPNPLRSFIHSRCSVASTAGGLTLMLYSSGDLFISIFFKLGPCHMLTAVPPPSFSTGSLFTFGPSSLKTTEASISIDANSTGAPNANRSAANGGGVTTTVHPVKKFVAAAVRSHFDDCPDSHRHFCFHGTCRFLILEEAPACVCHPGFVGMRCEHADLLAVVATNHRKQTVATVLVLCVIGCVFIMVLCTLLHCWWTHECRRRSRAHHYYIAEKHGASGHPSESVV